MSSINPQGLRLAVDRSGLSQARLAEECGISPSYAADIIAGRRNLSKNSALRSRLAAALGVPVTWIESASTPATSVTAVAEVETVVAP